MPYRLPFALAAVKSHARSTAPYSRFDCGLASGWHNYEKHLVAHVDLLLSTA